jgi:hypothetical protein
MVHTRIQVGRCVPEEGATQTLEDHMDLGSTYIALGIRRYLGKMTREAENTVNIQVNW